MKKSLIVRWIVIAVVILVWTWAMFPLRDSDYLTKFDVMSAKKVATVQKGAQALLAKGNPQEVSDKLAAIQDKNSQEAKDLAAKLEELRSDANFSDWRKARDYDELIKRLNLIKLKSQYEMASYIQGQMNETANKDGIEYKALAADYDKIVNAEGYKAWTETLEYKELVKRLPAQKMKAELEAMNDHTTEAYRKLHDAYKAAEATASAVPQFKDDAEKKAYEDTVRRLTLVYDVDRNISGYKTLEMAAGGNSELYRISLIDFVHIPFYKSASNKMVLRAVRVKSAGKLHLGLDLQGGTEFVLDFDIKEAQGLMITEKTTQGFLADFLSGNEKIVTAVPAELAAKINAAADVQKQAVPGIGSSDIARALVRNNEVLDSVRAFLSENTKLLKKDDMGAYGTVTDIRDRILNILDNRLNSMGVTEPEIKATGDNTISVRMPSVDEADKNEIRNTIRRAAKLQFYLVSTENSRLVSEYEADRQAFKTPDGVIRTEIEEERADGSVNYTPVFLEEEATPVRGEDIERAFATVDEFGRWIISLKFNASGTIAFREVTSKNVGRCLAIVLDGKVYSAPVLRTEIGNGQAQIEGRFTMEEAKRLASVIASGNVPVTVRIGSEFGTDPTLGADSVHTGCIAAIIGLAVVVVFMLYYYRVAGIIANIALIVNTLLVLGTMGITKATITMPGIAGMVLTIGMAVDANVIIFERIREELNSGSVISNAVVAGYGKAFWSIFDSNITTLLTCFFLYKYGTGSVKGFAVTLSFGILASMFTAIFMTHAIFDFLVYKDIIKKLPMRIFKCFININVDYLKYRKIAVIGSSTLVVICLATFAIKGNRMLGIDFAGGTELSYQCEGEEPDVEAVRSFLLEENYSDNVRVGYKRGQSGSDLLEIVLPVAKTNGVEDAVDYTAFSKRLDEKFPEVKISLKQTNTVGGNVGSQFRKGALLAGFLSVLGIIIYLAFRFEFMYGVGAAIAVIHDGIVSAGLFILFGGNLTLTVVAAVMTIMGYSLNDTIVIFDRIRETKEERKDLTYYELINKAVNECMSRTMLTSLTTMFVVVCLLVLGGGAVFEFAMVMFLGVVFGTYSTIFIASAFINTWHKRSLRAEREAEKARQNASKATAAKA